MHDIYMCRKIFSISNKIYLLFLFTSFIYQLRLWN